MIRLFSKTWVNDYPWLKLAIKSVLKLSTEVVDWTIVGDAGSKHDIEAVVLQGVQESKGALRYKIVDVPEHWPEALAIGNGYLAQQWVKMNAHRVMGDDLFWNWDSDVIATKPFSSKTFLGGSGKPVYWISQFNSIMNGADRPAHESRIELLKTIFGLNSIPKDYMGSEVTFEYMRCMPIPLYGGLLRQCAERAEWKRSFDILKSGDHRFSEFNVIGRAFHVLFPEAFEWRNAEAQAPTWSGGYVEGGVGSGCFQEHAYVTQFWSWSGVTKQAEDFVNSL